MSEEEKVKDFIRDPEVPGAVVNSDTRGLSAYRAAREFKLRQKKEFEALKSDVEDIKKLLIKLLEKN